MSYRSTERSEQRRQQMRQVLITATRDLFVRQGYKATTMQQIVREADISISNCYFYLPTKEALLRAVVEAFSTSIGQAIDITIAHLPLALSNSPLGFPEPSGLCYPRPISSVFYLPKPSSLSYDSLLCTAFFYASLFSLR
ncbi:TetR/AcrR family transcriptional regulator [Ktedonobacter robiniae]|uniref:HTH tetR-type domain-containing protein n=1 Tax=Ktedonobacter robiniae TaxID=2778365 RepID=A0ABQ3UXM6_9CHLR|nr:helix-turn-helix domain-containing protein [Ktedonobacter robiniae]GHO57523.1 hypothetical protein KSB_59980 [Ktedonobacter robiniae]